MSSKESEEQSELIDFDSSLEQKRLHAKFLRGGLTSEELNEELE